MQKLRDVIELYELQQYYEAKAKNPDYIAIMAGATKGAIIGETANVMTRWHVTWSTYFQGTFLQ